MTQRYLGLVVASGLLGFGGMVRNWRIAHSNRWNAGAAAQSPTSSSSPSFQLTEVSQKVGLVNVHRKAEFAASLRNVAPMLAAVGGASAAVVDFDGDGWMDIYLTNSAKGSHNKLFRNNHDGTFTEMAEKAGIGDVNREGGSLSALFFDYDNDGHKDLLLQTYGCAKLFHNDGRGKFREVAGAGGIQHCGFGYAMNVVDYDNDGYLDVVIADYYSPHDYLNGPGTTKIMPNSQVAADNGGPITVFHNNHNGTFTRVPGDLGLKSRGWTHAVGVYDFRGDGRRDLYFATDYGSDQVYLADGRGGYVDSSRGVVEKHSKSGMSAEIADVFNDGHASVYVSNIYEPPYTIGENVLWRWEGGASPFRNIARETGVDRCGWSWGDKFVDLDNDGFQDLVVSNGFLSANPKKSYWYTYGVLYAGRSGVSEDTRNWPPIGDKSISGNQRDCVFRNVGGRFEDVSDSVGIDGAREDGRAVAAIDYLNDGSMSLIVTNQGQPARFYANRQINQNHWLGLSLKGRSSNRDAFGAEVAVRLKDGTTQTRQLEPANGFLSESDPRLHFGLGADSRLDRVDIVWPSGIRQSLADLALDRYHVVTEPEAPNEKH